MTNSRELFTALLFLIHAFIVIPEEKAVSQNFPPIQINIYDSSATEGYYFLAPYASSPPYTYSHPQLILDRFGNVVWYRILFGFPKTTTTYDFKIQPDGRMTYYYIQGINSV